MTSVDGFELLELAVGAAKRAGTFLVQGRPAEGPGVVRTKSSPTDVVTAMDTEAERMLIDTLRSARPGDGVLAEEGGGIAGDSGIRWVLDPIDGTVNYFYGLPEWSVSVAAEVDGEVEAGAVYVAPRDELFTAVRGAGAWRGGTPLGCNEGVPLDRALVATGFGYAAERRASQAEVLRGILPAVRDIRRGGAASVDLCSVACGRVDAYYERGLSQWDFAAGALIADEAGARVAGLDGRPAGEDLTIAAAPGLFEWLHDLLGHLGRSR